MATKEKQTDFSFETVAVLCCAIICNGGSIGQKSYDLMSSLDGKRSSSAFQHQFRAVLKRAREMKETMEGDGDIKTAGPAYKRGGKVKNEDGEEKPKGTKKRGRTGAKTKDTNVKEDDIDGDDGDDGDTKAGDDGREKRFKSETLDTGSYFDDALGI